MDLIHQKLLVKDWPLKKAGDELFFGYVVAVGWFPRDWSETGMFAYADFAYNNDYFRYRLPDDPNLIKQLLGYVSGNLETLMKFGDVYGKVWIELTDKGYTVDLP